MRWDDHRNSCFRRVSMRGIAWEHAWDCVRATCQPASLTQWMSKWFCSASQLWLLWLVHKSGVRNPDGPVPLQWGDGIGIRKMADNTFLMPLCSFFLGRYHPVILGLVMFERAGKEMQLYSLQVNVSNSFCWKAKTMKAVWPLLLHNAQD